MSLSYDSEADQAGRANANLSDDDPFMWLGDVARATQQLSANAEVYAARAEAFNARRRLRSDTCQEFEELRPFLRRAENGDHP